MEKDGGFEDERSPRAEVDRARGLPIDSLPALTIDRAVCLDMAVRKVTKTEFATKSLQKIFAIWVSK